MLYRANKTNISKKKKRKKRKISRLKEKEKTRASSTNTEEEGVQCLADGTSSLSDDEIGDADYGHGPCWGYG